MKFSQSCALKLSLNLDFIQVLKGYLNSRLHNIWNKKNPPTKHQSSFFLYNSTIFMIYLDSE